MRYNDGDFPTVTDSLLSMCAAGYPGAIQICSMAAAFAWLREWRRQHNSRPYAIEARRRWKRENREHMLAQAKEYNARQEVAEKRNNYYKTLAEKHPDRAEAYKQRDASYFQANKQKIYRRINNHLATNPQAKLGNRIRAYVGNVLKKRCGFKEESFHELVGCSTDALKAHLEAQFQPGMTWDNWTVNGWHIDHVRPLASFDLSNKAQRLEAFHFLNLKPEWADVNRSKSSFYEGERWVYSSCTPQPTMAS